MLKRKKNYFFQVRISYGKNKWLISRKVNAIFSVIGTNTGCYFIGMAQCGAVQNPSVRGTIVSRRVARGVHEIARRGEVDNSAIENSWSTLSVLFVLKRPRVNNNSRLNALSAPLPHCAHLARSEIYLCETFVQPSPPPPPSLPLRRSSLIARFSLFCCRITAYNEKQKPPPRG